MGKSLPLFSYPDPSRYSLFFSHPAQKGFRKTAVDPPSLRACARIVVVCIDPLAGPGSVRIRPPGCGAKTLNCHIDPLPYRTYVIRGIAPKSPPQ